MFTEWAHKNSSRSEAGGQAGDLLDADLLNAWTAELRKSE